MKAQYHQCIPNPKRPGEMVSVQLCSLWATSYVNNSSMSIKDMGKEANTLIQPYSLQVFEEETMNRLFKKFSLNNSARFGEIKQKVTQQPLIGKGYDAELIELGDEIKTKMQPSDESIHQGALDKKNQIAIIGLWRKDE